MYSDIDIIVVVTSIEAQLVYNIRKLPHQKQTIWDDYGELSANIGRC